mmetsp:Transcript_18299/g.51508  ORF Transcript_18299/g.51508 Transcript_18299/m.51508 type:complete len:130 (-) Transcript_18299:1516-1905(-)
MNGETGILPVLFRNGDGQTTFTPSEGEPLPGHQSTMLALKKWLSVCSAAMHLAQPLPHRERERFSTLKLCTPPPPARCTDAPTRPRTHAPTDSYVPRVRAHEERGTAGNRSNASILCPARETYICVVCW